MKVGKRIILKGSHHKKIFLIVIDVDWICHRDNSTIYTNIKFLCSIPEIYVIMIFISEIFVTGVLS